MPNTGKSEQSPEERLMRLTLVSALSELSPLVGELVLLTPVEVGVVLIRNANILEKDRAMRKAALLANSPIAPLSPLSLPFLNEDGKESHPVRYLARDLLAYLQRISQSVPPSPPLAPTPAPAQASPPLFFPPLDGFDAWLAQASPVDVWPFSIQSDGHPLDLATAIRVGRLTGAAELLTLREFGSRLAEAAAASYA